MEKLNIRRDEIQVASAFDEVADRYDSIFDSSLVTQRLRRRIYSTIQSLLRSESSILDVNCGTGTDARYLASHGYQVLGLDVSTLMIEQAKRKSRGMSGIEFQIGSFENLSSVVTGKFDLVLSNFGGLNCTKNLSKLAKELSPVLWPEGYFIAVVMPPFSLWEFLSYSLRFDWSKATRRMRGNARATGFNSTDFKVHYHSPAALRSTFAQLFEPVSLIGMNIVSPPPHAKTFFQSYPKLSKRLEKVDMFLEEVPFIRSCGDHYLITFRRRQR